MKSSEVSKREMQLIKAMRECGYACTFDGQAWHLRHLGNRWFSAVDIPYTFKSPQSAAEHLCPIIHSHSFTAVVIQEEGQN